MHLPWLAILLTLVPLLIPATAHKPCTYARKVRGIQHEIDTITSHAFTDARRIPLAPLASRTFFVTPNEFPNTTLKINTGVTAASVRAELVGLARFLDAKVVPRSLRYIRNANGSVTTDFVQLDRFVLPYAHAREIHEFNAECEITRITGFVHSSLACPAGARSLANAAMDRLCREARAEQGAG